MRKAYRESRVYNLFRNIKINNSLFLKSFGFITWGLLSLKRSPKLKRIKTRWENYTSSYAGYSWWEYFACYMIYGVLPEEYICYDYRNLDDKGKREFVTDLSREEIYKKCNNPNFVHIFENKYETYCLLKSYYQRDALLLNGTVSNDELLDFIVKHKKIVCKPINLYLGKGIEILNTEDFKDIKDEQSYLLSLVQQNKEYILEDLIVQSADLGIFHPQSVNTIRIPTFRTKDGIVICQPFFKSGQGDNIVDNGGHGGILTAVDAETGVLISRGVDEKGTVFLKHPDSGIVFFGYQLPDWQQVIQIVTECMQFVPEVKYVGWDLAHTEQGWIIVEGNFRGQFVGQIPLKSGCAREIEAILARI